MKKFAIPEGDVYKRQINYWVMMHQVEKDSQEIIKHYIKLSKSQGKSL